jgi:hypothetical protein
MDSSPIDLAHLFQSAEAALILRQDELNQADPHNHNHGDHMVEVFQAATEAAAIKDGSGLAEAMEYAAALLRHRPENGSAQVYARGLSELAAQFRQRGLDLDDLTPYVRSTLAKRMSAEPLPEAQPAPAGANSGEVLKALLNGLAAWEKAERSSAGSGAGENLETGKNSLDLGYLFGVGLSYLQAKQKGGHPLDILAETVVASSPLARLPHRHESGKIALRAILGAMGGN